MKIFSTTWSALSLFFRSGLRTSPRTSVFIVVLASLNAILYNWPLLLYSIENLDGFTLDSARTLITVFAVIYLVTTLVLYLLFLLSRRLGKVICAIIAMANSLAVYFVVTYNVILDITMMGNIFNTQFSESSQFLTPNLLLYMAVLGVLPAWLILQSRVQKTSRGRLLTHLVITLVITSTWIWQSQQYWLWIDDHAKQLGGRIMPWSYVGNVVRYHQERAQENVTQTLLPDATFLSNPTRLNDTNPKEKTVVVLVIGESARAENFALYGYDKPTNPLLSGSDIITLKNATSCATYTTAAVKCILSHNDPSGVFAENFEPLPSYLQRQGIDVFWRSNNWGEPPINVASYQGSGALEARCEGQECQFDGVLLSHLAEQIQASDKQKIFVVLHQTGSHGPAYYSKYPPAFEQFTPVCRSVELGKCSQEELINAYDNTLVYNDHFLATLRNTLAELSNTASAFLYVSDHGESLGENGIYLHGTPYSIAPEQQLKVPFLMWLSPSFMEQKHLSVDVLKAREQSTQANVFHTVMGAFDMRSEIYDPTLDMFTEATKR